MDESMDPKLEKALERYALLGQLLYFEKARGDTVRLVRQLAGGRFTLAEGKTHLSRATIYRALKKAREGGARSLVRKARSDKGAIRAITPEVLQALLDLRQAYPAASVPVLVRTLERQGTVAEGELSHATVRRILRRLSPKEPARPRRAYRPFEVEGPMALWQGDASPGPWLHGKRLQLFSWMDVYSRAIVAAGYYHNQRLPAFDDCLWRAIARHSAPRAVHVDNSGGFISRHFVRVLADLGVSLIHQTPYEPTGKGRIERSFRTMQEQFEASLIPLIESGEVQTLDEVNDFLARWLEHEYNPRPNSTTRQAPISRLGETTPYPDLRKLAEIFLWREERDVSRRGEVALGGNRYAVPDELTGMKKVTVAFHPFDLSEVYVERPDRTIVAKPAVPLTNAVLPELSKEPTKKRRTAPPDYLRKLPLRTHALPSPEATSSLTDASFTELLQTALGRELHVEEKDLVRLTLSRPGLPAPPEAKERLCAFVRRSGRDLHLSRYLDAITKEGSA